MDLTLWHSLGSGLEYSASGLLKHELRAHGKITESLIFMFLYTHNLLPTTDILDTCFSLRKELEIPNQCYNSNMGQMILGGERVGHLLTCIINLGWRKNLLDGPSTPKTK